MNSSKQIKLGALISYFAIFFNIIAGLIYTPWMITKIGQSNYGLYTLTTSLITLFVMDFGMGAAVSRFVSKYNAEGRPEAVNNFLGLVYKLYFSIDAIILIALIAVYFFIESIYVNLAAAELETLKTLYIIVGLFSVVSFPFTNLNGILTSYERFIELKLCDLFHKIFIIISMVVLLLMGYGVYALVVINAISGLITIGIKLFVIKRKTPVRVNLKYFEKGLLKEIFGFSVWTTVSSIMERFTFNIMPSIIAAVSLSGSVGVAIFGLATTIEGYIYTFSTAISGMFMPRISKILAAGKKDTQLMPLMIKIGRIQFMIVGIMTIGFISFGHSFILEIWNKPDFGESYICAILLTLPSLFFLPMQIGSTTIIVENKVKLRSYVFIITAIVNIILAVPLTKLYGAVGAASSIFIAYMIRTTLMVLIYKKVLKLNMKLFFKKTFFKLFPYLFILLLMGVLCELYNPISNSYLRFFANGVVLIVTFFVIMMLKGFNDYEKNMIKRILSKVKRRNKNVLIH